MKLVSLGIEGHAIEAPATGRSCKPSCREAVQQWRQHALFAALERLLGGPLSLAVVASSGLYLGGEETAVIASFVQSSLQRRFSL